MVSGASVPTGPVGTDRNKVPGGVVSKPLKGGLSTEW